MESRFPLVTYFNLLRLFGLQTFLKLAADDEFGGKLKAKPGWKGRKDPPKLGNFAGPSSINWTISYSGYENQGEQ